MITDDGVEVHDQQPQDVGGGEDYARPFGTPESKAETLGFLDANPIVRPRAESRLARWLHLHVYRPWK